MDKDCCKEPNIEKTSNGFGYSEKECLNCGKMTRSILGRELTEWDDNE